jgi:hypothetical protein
MADQAENSTNASASSAEAAAAAAQNQTIIPDTCLIKGGVPIVLQNSTSWQDSGCLLGFYCKLRFPGMSKTDALSLLVRCKQLCS